VSDEADARILARLRAAAWVSGAELGAELGLSRAAVGKRVAALRRAGFAIAAAPRRGYHLSAEPDRLLPEVVIPRLTTARFGRALRSLEECGSTNDEAAAWARQGAPEGAVVVAERQTAGRGRAGRAWFSPPGASLYCSVVARPPVSPLAVPPLTLAAGIAVHDAIAGLGLAADLKWPNDVLIDGQKVCGILTEMSADLERVHHVIVGLGINVNGTSFPPALAGRATSLRLARGGAAGPPFERAAVLAAVLAQLERWLDRFVAEGAAAIAREVAGRCSQIGRGVRVQLGDALVAGTATGVAVDGALLVTRPDGATVRIIAGEVLLWD
jgi:BirA family biotin operon repressor/biotin-[acetyl-CoA-carboxylase] ligase